ncbi:MAG: ribonuclease Z [Candidatus Bathyarchaeota archaeon]|nr:ribonuclease Z [Candidatus Bathyarchaeota archaeon]
MRVLIVGSGSGIPIAGHFNESVLVESNGSSYLFDAGEPCAATMHTNALRSFYGLPQVCMPIVDIYSIRSIFISHSDADHISGLPMLLQTMHLWQKRDETFRFKPENKLALYMPVEIMEPFKSFLQATNLKNLRYTLEIMQIEEGEFYADETSRVSAFQNTHRKNEHSYSFILQAEGKRLVYSGDLGNELEVLPLLQDAADLVIVECAHFSPERLFRALKGKEKNIRKLIVNHIHPRLYGQEEEIASLGRKHLDCEVIASGDNLEISV